MRSALLVCASVLHISFRKKAQYEFVALIVVVVVVVVVVIVVVVSSMYYVVQVACSSK